MSGLNIKEAVLCSGGELVHGVPEERIPGFSIDTRTIEPGDFYIAIRGRRLDGHAFAAEAVKRGAGGLIVEEDPELPSGQASPCVIRVQNTLTALSQLAIANRSKMAVPTVCVTGTNGKTTVKDMLSGLLSSRFNVLSNKLSYNNLIGVSLTLLELRDDHDIGIFEIGTNHPGEIARLARMVSPMAGVITNIGRGHLENFGDLESVLREKTSLTQEIDESGILFVNGDNVFLKDFDSPRIKVVRFGSSPHCEVRITDIVPERNGYGFSINGERLYLPVNGRHNVHNFSAAAGVAFMMGMTFDEISGGIEGLRLPGMRLEEVVCGEVTFINDAYNANPDSFLSALKALKEKAGDNRKVVVAGDMLELGELSGALHRETGEAIAGSDIDVLITVGEQAAHIAKGARNSGMREESVYCGISHEKAAELIRSIAGPGSYVLIKGSRGAGMEEVLKCYMNCYTR